MRILGLAVLALTLVGCATGPNQPAISPAAEPESSVEASASSAPEPENPVEQEEAPTLESSDESESAPETSDETSEEPAAATSSPAATQSSPSPTAESEPEASEEVTEEPAAEEEVVGYTLSEVALRNSPSDCWVAISGSVYDLTDWIAEHPGGSGAISRLCGRDGTSQFSSQHGGASAPENALAGFYLAPLIP